MKIEIRARKYKSRKANTALAAYFLIMFGLNAFLSARAMNDASYLLGSWFLLMTSVALSVTVRYGKAALRPAAKESN